MDLYKDLFKAKGKVKMNGSKESVFEQTLITLYDEALNDLSLSAEKRALYARQRSRLLIELKQP